MIVRRFGMAIVKLDLGKSHYDPFSPHGKTGERNRLAGLSISYGIVKMHDGSIEVERAKLGKVQYLEFFYL